MSVKAVYLKCKSEKSIYALTKTWRGSLLPGAKRGFWKSAVPILFASFHGQNVDMHLIKRDHNTIFRSKSIPVATTFEHEFGKCNQSPKKVQVRKVWRVEENIPLPKTHHLREKNTDFAIIWRFYETTSPNWRLESIQLVAFGLIESQKSWTSPPFFIKVSLKKSKNFWLNIKLGNFVSFINQIPLFCDLVPRNNRT